MSLRQQLFFGFPHQVLSNPVLITFYTWHLMDRSRRIFYRHTFFRTISDFSHVKIYIWKRFSPFYHRRTDNRIKPIVKFHFCQYCLVRFIAVTTASCSPFSELLKCLFHFRFISIPFFSIWSVNFSSVRIEK